MVSPKALVAASAVAFALTALPYSSYAQTPAATQPNDAQQTQPADRPAQTGQPANDPAARPADRTAQPTGTAGQQPADRPADPNRGAAAGTAGADRADALPATASPLALLALGTLSAFAGAGTLHVARRRRN